MLIDSRLKLPRGLRLANQKRGVSPLVSWGEEGQRFYITSRSGKNTIPVLKLYYITSRSGKNTIPVLKLYGRDLSDLLVDVCPKADCFVNVLTRVRREPAICNISWDTMNGRILFLVKPVNH